MQLFIKFFFIINIINKMDNYYNNCIFYNEYDNILDENNKNVENGSRLLIQKYIKPDMKILELGVRYHTVNVYLDYLVNDA